MANQKYQTRVNGTIAERIEEYRTDSDGNELKTKSDATRDLIVDGLEADRPLMSLNQVLIVAFMSVAFNAALNGQPGVLTVAALFAGGMALLDGVWAVAAQRYGVAGPRETYTKAANAVRGAET